MLFSEPDGKGRETGRDRRYMGSERDKKADRVLNREGWDRKRDERQRRKEKRKSTTARGSEEQRGGTTEEKVTA